MAWVRSATAPRINGRSMSWAYHRIGRSVGGRPVRAQRRVSLAGPSAMLGSRGAALGSAFAEARAVAEVPPDAGGEHEAPAFALYLEVTQRASDRAQAHHERQRAGPRGAAAAPMHAGGEVRFHVQVVGVFEHRTSFAPADRADVVFELERRGEVPVPDRRAEQRSLVARVEL